MQNAKREMFIERAGLKVTSDPVNNQRWTLDVFFVPL